MLKANERMSNNLFTTPSPITNVTENSFPILLSDMMHTERPHLAELGRSVQHSRLSDVLDTPHCRHSSGLLAARLSALPILGFFLMYLKFQFRNPNLQAFLHI